MIWNYKEAVKKFVESDAFTKLMESLDKQDRAATEDAEQFLRDIKAKEQEDNGFFDEIMDDSEDGEVYEKIKEIIEKVKEQEE